MKRRKFIAGLTAAAGGLSAGRLMAGQGKPSATGAGSCRLITQDVTGPFHTDRYPDRSNLFEGQKGMPLTLNFVVRSVMSCEPLPGARVILWHANNDGFYSGVVNPILNADGTTSDKKADFRDQNFHRGMQTTDALGRVQFVTAFPGWYFPRVTHLHLKVIPPDFGEEATTQLYFRNEICDEVYASEHYRHRGPNPTRRKPGDQSPVFSFDDESLWLNITRTGDGYQATHQLDVAFYGGMFGELTDYYRQG
jgi:protocatechuate 3,4-dioxygenase beta subunit